MDYTLAQLRGFCAAIERQEISQARLALAIGRASWADDVGYKKMWRMLGGKE